jgi:CPA2 family monovalent cation:H+ antiporter-2
MGRWLAARSAPGSSRKSSSDEEAPERPSRYRAVVVGYGPVGRTVARLLKENDVEPTIVELNLDVVQGLKNRGVAAFYGDATHRETLAAAGVATAGTFILSAAGLPGAKEIIRQARELNPDIRVLARAGYVAEMPVLREVGADGVFSGEGEVALAFTVAVMRVLGATPEQIDREQERVRLELFGSKSPREIPPPSAAEPEKREQPTGPEPSPPRTDREDLARAPAGDSQPEPGPTDSSEEPTP